jgi:DNA-binding transcriptional ArsR family regulator
MRMGHAGDFFFRSGNRQPGKTRITAVLFSALLLTNLVMSALALPGSIPLTTGQDGASSIPYGLTAIRNNSGGNNDVPGQDVRLQIAEGNWFKVLLFPDGTVQCRGLNDRGQCNVPPGLTGVTAIEAGDDFTLALLENGTVIGWGNNDHGQIMVPANLSGVSKIAVGSDFGFAIRDGTITAWGNNDHGQTDVPANLSGVSVIAGGKDHGIALTQDGTPVAWGDNRFGQSTVPAGLHHVQQVAAGGYHNVALTENRTVVCWGMNTQGQCDVPPDLTNVTRVLAGVDYSVAFRDDGRSVRWGTPPHAWQQGDGWVPSPITATNLADASNGAYDLVLLCENGDLHVWTWNDYNLESILEDNAGPDPPVLDHTSPNFTQVQRVSPKDLEDHPYRSRICETIAANPGLQFNNLCRTADINRGTLRHHLNVLLSARIIVAKEYAGKTVYFPNDGRLKDPERRLLVHLKNPARRELLTNLHNHGHLCRRDLIDRSRLSAAAAAWHLKSLSDEGMVQIEKCGREAHYSLHPDIASGFSGLAASTAD